MFWLLSCCIPTEVPMCTAAVRCCGQVRSNQAQGHTHLLRCTEINSTESRFWARMVKWLGGWVFWCRAGFCLRSLDYLTSQGKGQFTSAEWDTLLVPLDLRWLLSRPFYLSVKINQAWRSSRAALLNKTEFKPLLKAFWKHGFHSSVGIKIHKPVQWW